MALCRQRTTAGIIPTSAGPFRLRGDDFRAGNILLDEADEMAAIIDLEFAYAGPTQFILDSPGWLLLDLAETWDFGIDD
ncbi:kinase-like domain [Fusarium austroafricanum]|uniref:Kinase-like domain n=1 Tax=Fusarium austroafricanum TaxID=2364996 RepID=A0A8H4JL64_9HYPO|nr:kinase-like domain [Fusarium austroafricanum]